MLELYTNRNTLTTYLSLSENVFMEMEFDFKEISDSNSRFLKKKFGDDMIKFMKFEYKVVSKMHLTL